VQSPANPFDDGSTNTITTTTNYNDLLIVGSIQPHNVVLISNATVQATQVVVGELEGSTNNLLTVNGSALLLAGSSDTNGLTTGGIVVGSHADDETALTLDNDSAIQTDYLYIGFGTNDSGEVVLSGDGSELNVANDAFVGYAGSTNSVTVNNGTTLSVGGVLNVGYNGGSNNSVVVRSGGTLFVNSTNSLNVVDHDADNSIDINGGGTLQIGGDVETGTLEDDLGVELVRNSNVEVGGLLTLTGNELDDSYNVILNDGLSAETAALFVNSGVFLNIGDSVSHNSLTLTNGATGSSSIRVNLGNQSSSSDNSLIVGGPGSTFNALNDMLVGVRGDFNELTISDEGQVTVANSLYVGKNSSSTGNSVNINSNSTLVVGGDIIVGDNGNNNDFNLNYGNVTVANDFILGAQSSNNDYDQVGGTNTVSGNFIIGETAAASGDTGHVDNDTIETTGNLALIGKEAVLNIAQDLTVGREGSGSIMAIRDGGIVNVTGDAVIGESVGDNYIYLQRGSNTQFNVGGDLIVGVEGGVNRFAVYGGTATISGDLLMGTSTNQHDSKNFMHMETTNAVVYVAGSMQIGASNALNTLDLVDGATLGANELVIGAFDGVSNNTVTVRGDDSLMYITNNLIIGNTNGIDNELIVRNGGTLNVEQSNIILSGTNNTLEIANGGTLKTDDWDYSLMTGTATNILFDSGSTLQLLGILSGTNAIEGGMTVVLDGTNSSWNTTSNVMYVGNSTDGNTLSLENGALANTDTNLVVGNSADSTGNSLEVSGSGSVAQIGNDLLVGNDGSSDNLLEIMDGGMVNVSNDFILGFESGNNTARLAGLAGTNATLNVSGHLTVGMEGNGNELFISSNAVVNISGLAMIGDQSNNNLIELNGSNAVLNVSSNLIAGTEDASGNRFTISEGVANLGGNLVLGSETNGINNRLTVAGSNSTLNVGSELIVGYGGDNNRADIADGATVNVSSNAWIGMASSGNYLEVIGTNSMLSVANNLYIGSTNGLSEGNALGVYETAMVWVGGDLSLSSSEIEIEYGSQVEVAGNYNQDADSVLKVSVSTNSVRTNLVVAGTANFEEDSIIAVFGDETIPEELVDEDGNTNKVTRTIVAAGNLTIDDQAATSSLLHTAINFQTNSLFGFSYAVTNNTIYLDNFTRRSIKDAAGLTGMLADVADEIEAMATATNELAKSMIQIFQDGMTDAEINEAMRTYYGERESSVPAHNVINMGIQSVAEQLTLRADNTRSRLGSATASVNWNKPQGVAGPHQAGQELQGWVAGYGTWGDMSETDGFNGYDTSVSGFMIGMDLSVSENILAGLAGGSGSGTIDQNNGASTDTRTVYGSLYGSIGTESWFADASFIYGESSSDTTLGSTFDTTGEFDAQNFAFYFGGGKEMLTDYLIITPQASLLGNYYTQDAYKEKSTTSVPRSIDSYDAFYLQSSVGLTLGAYMGLGEITFKPEIRAYWLHEFNASEENLNYSLIDGTGGIYSLNLQAPEEDILKLGIGSSARLGEYLEVRADLDTRQSANYSDFTLLGSLRYQF
jgi:T5SS/PEP-CTERM-associated repeat protein